MKTARITLLLILCILSLELKAKDDDVPQTYRVDYLVESYLREGTDTLHFVKVDLEWPSWIDGRRPSVLIKHLSKTIFGVEGGVSMEEVLSNYLGSLGKSITTVPDDTTIVKVYHSHELRLIDYSPAKYISFRVKTASRDSKTIYIDDPLHHIFTYDFVNDKILTSKDLVKKSCFVYEALGQRFCRTILDNTPSYYRTNYINKEIMGTSELCLPPRETCLMRNGLVCDIGYADENSLDHVLTFLDYKNAEPYFNKKTINYLNMSVTPQTVQLPNKKAIENVLTPDTSIVYDKVNDRPEFIEENGAVGEYFSNNLKYPSVEQIFNLSGKVYVQFIVERDGSISSPAVISPASPGFDRETVRVTRMMPRWKPGKINGVAVRTRVILPITWQTQ